MKIVPSISKYLLCGALGILSQADKSCAQNKIDRVEPLNWWTGMQYNKIQLIVHGDNIGSTIPSISNKGIQLDSFHKVENPNYLFIDITILPSAKSGTFPINLKKDNKIVATYNYELKDRQKTVKAQGVSSKDFIYLLMPDRFANGDTSNDKVAGLQDSIVNRQDFTARHGGDLKGVIQHLDYLQELGVTSLWMTPVLTNDEKATSYHGYANTENYFIDPRYGSNELFKALTDSLHRRGMKMVMDVVPNHFGDQHWTVKDMPMKDWVHQWSSYTNSNFRDQAVYDPYAADIDKKTMVNGWFDKHMPDMNESNPYVQKYITQSNIWWIEYAGVDAFRIDTYPYNDPAFMANWAMAIRKEYPTFSMFGEAWVGDVVSSASFTEGNTVNRGIDTHLPGVTDFQIRNALSDALTHSFSWDDGVMRLYSTLSKDFVYKDASRNVVFLDNHDLSRFYSVVDQNTDKLKSALAFLLTTRGIPQLYYGTEILYKGFTNPDGLVRQDMEGGWATDAKNKFTANGRSEAENEMFDYVRTIANYRKNNSVLQTSKLLQYVPMDGIYVYFRSNDTKTVMVLMNTNSKTISVTLDRFAQGIGTKKSGVDILSKEAYNSLKEINVPAFSTKIIELY